MKTKRLLFKTKNIKLRVEKDVQPFLRRLAEKEYVEGIVLLGGLGKRNFIDAYSDIDIAVFYKVGTPSKYFLPFEFHLVINNVRYEFNIHQLFYRDQKSIEWGEGIKEAYSRARIFIDKRNRIEKLIQNKVAFDEKSSYNRLIWIMQQYKWRGQIHSLRSYHRGYPESAHDLLNECTDMLIEAIYIINKMHRGHKKWVVAMLNTMDIIPANFFKNLRQALTVNNFSLSDIHRRIKYLDNIYVGILDIIRTLYPNFPKDPYKYYYKNFYQLKKKTFSQPAVIKYEKILSTEELEQLEGLLCFNLASSSSEIDRYVKHIQEAYSGNGLTKTENLVMEEK